MFILLQPVGVLGGIKASQIENYKKKKKSLLDICSTVLLKFSSFV